jgi:polyribonucleotide nucleotidyltransferase
MMTNAPYKGPIGAMRVGMIDGQFILSPSEEQMETSQLNLTIAATKERIMMIETEANEVSEEQAFEAMKLAMDAMKPAIEIQYKIAEDHRKQVLEEEKNELDSIHTEVHKLMSDKIKEALMEMDKEAREAKLKIHEAEVMESLEGTYKQVDIKSAFGKIVEKEIRQAILDKDLRPDGRGLEEIRPLGIEVGILPRPHGSALFTRGQTQALTVATLASPGMEQLIDTMEGESTKRFMHHYNFPPYSTGEVRPMRGAGRREIGHGYLAEKALKPMIPDSDSFPYTIRLVSEILSSNGSSSMAATCGSTLALMDAGVPIKKPVAGIAMGLVTNADSSVFMVFRTDELHRSDWWMVLLCAVAVLPAVELAKLADRIRRRPRQTHEVENGVAQQR